MNTNNTTAGTDSSKLNWSNKGFTLIELATVVAIIGILAVWIIVISHFVQKFW